MIDELAMLEFIRYSSFYFWRIDGIIIKYIILWLNLFEPFSKIGVGRAVIRICSIYIKTKTQKTEQVSEFIKVKQF